jgi:hypothetical protein
MSGSDDLIVTTLVGLVAWYVIKYCIIYAIEIKTGTKVKELIKTLPVVHIIVFLTALLISVLTINLQQCSQKIEKTGISAIIISVCALAISVAYRSSRLHTIDICNALCKSVFLIMFVSALQSFPSTQCTSIILVLSATVILCIELSVTYDIVFSTH